MVKLKSGSKGLVRLFYLDEHRTCIRWRPSRKSEKAKSKLLVFLLMMGHFRNGNYRARGLMGHTGCLSALLPFCSLSPVMFWGALGAAGTAQAGQGNPQFSRALGCEAVIQFNASGLNNSELWEAGRGWLAVPACPLVSFCPSCHRLHLQSQRGPAVRDLPAPRRGQL